MATTDAKKREANITAAALRPATVPVDVMLKSIALIWARFGWPESEKDAARSWAGTIERLYNHCAEYNNAVDEKKRKVADSITPLPYEIKEAIQTAARLHSGTPLQLARHFKLPLDVVLYVADGEPKIDTMQRPWLRSNRRSY